MGDKAQDDFFILCVLLAAEIISTFAIYIGLYALYCDKKKKSNAKKGRSDPEKEGDDSTLVDNDKIDDRWPNNDMC